jgi:hypothetical protein
MRLRVLAALSICVAAFAIPALRPAGEPPGGIAPPPDGPPGLSDLWDGRASLVLARKWTSTSLGAPGGGAYEGAHVEVVGARWYLFDRRRTGVPCTGRSSVQGMATQVRESTDRGRTWGPPHDILTPTPGTPWSCAATDGDAAYDATTGTWHYLFQCLADQGDWAGCTAQRHAASPVGPFTPPPGTTNPVIGSGQLWSQICASPAASCHRAPGQSPVRDEGTFTLLPAADGGWWVSFHGYDGVHGFRGIARTRTFGTDGWQVDGRGGTPTDAALGARDAAGWRESWQPGGPVGPGAAGLIEQDGLFYALAELPDENLACTSGQNWDVGLFRTASLASTHWQQYPAGNPLVYSSRTPGPTGEITACNVQYPGLFADPGTGTTYLMFGRASPDPAYDGVYVYRLEWNRNLLGNGDLWRADGDGWQPYAGSTARLSVPRAPDRSPDGTPYLAFNCGAPACDGVQSVYQDVAVPPRLVRDTVAFGATVGTDSRRGRLEVTLVQLDAAGAEVARATIATAASAHYQRVRRRVRVDPRATRLRFQLYPRDPVTFRADNLYVIPQDGCAGPRFPAC